VTWVTFETLEGGLVVAQLRHIVAIYDEQGQVKLATAAGGEHVLKEMSVQRAVARISAAEDAEAAAAVAAQAPASLLPF
jgi:hypothetical protein